MVEQLKPNLYTIPVPLPDNPLRNLNSYVLTTPTRNLIIDTGFRRPECLEALQSGIREIGLDMEQTDLFITHFHADHSGLVEDIASPGSTLYMGAADVDILTRMLLDSGSYWKSIKAAFLAQGYPPEVLRQSVTDSPIRRYSPKHDLPFVPVSDGTRIQLGDKSLTCISTPGHTPGHTCLYLEEEKILFSGDHVLFTITPNITPWANFSDTLGVYLESLEKIKRYDIERTFAAHRMNGPDIYARVDELIAHHMERLRELFGIVAENPGINGYDAASKMTWAIRTKDWESFPPAQKYFAVGEAAAHLIYLEQHGNIRSQAVEGICTYTVTSAVE